jgi:hypothetical protein
MATSARRVALFSYEIFCFSGSLNGHVNCVAIRLRASSPAGTDAPIRSGPAQLLKPLREREVGLRLWMLSPNAISTPIHRVRSGCWVRVSGHTAELTGPLR